MTLSREVLGQFDAAGADLDRLSAGQDQFAVAAERDDVLAARSGVIVVHAAGRRAAYLRAGIGEKIVDAAPLREAAFATCSV